MAKTLYVSENFIIADDNGNQKQVSKSKSSYKEENETFVIIDDITRIRIMIPFSEAVTWIDSESGGSAYTESTLRLFIRTNFSAASGGSGAELSSSLKIGQYVWLDSNDVDNVFIQMNGQVITNGVNDYSDLASIRPSWIVGNDLHIPDWSGRFLRNIGGNSALSSGGLQDDMIKEHDHQYVDRHSQQFTGNGNGNNVALRGNVNENKTTGLVGGIENRPISVTLVLCVVSKSIIDYSQVNNVTFTNSNNSFQITNEPTQFAGQDVPQATCKVENGGIIYSIGAQDISNLGGGFQTVMSAVSLADFSGASAALTESKISLQINSAGGSPNTSIVIENGNINFKGLPTNSTGLETGDLWNDSGTIKIA